jgi:hypothetical protein
MLLNGYCFASADWRRGSWDDRWSFRFWVPHDRRREWAALQRRSICSCKQTIQEQNIDDIRGSILGVLLMFLAFGFPLRDLELQLRDRRFITRS